MATHKSAEKRHRQSLKRKTRNRLVKVGMKKAMREAREAITNGSDKASELVKRAESLIAKASTKGVIHKNSARRKISRLAKKKTK